MVNNPLQKGRLFHEGTGTGRVGPLDSHDGWWVQLVNLSGARTHMADLPTKALLINDFAHIPCEDTPNFPKPPQRKKFLHIWWNFQGIFQGYVGEILDFVEDHDFLPFSFWVGDFSDRSSWRLVEILRDTDSMQHLKWSIDTVDDVDGRNPKQSPGM